MSKLGKIKKIIYGNDNKIRVVVLKALGIDTLHVEDFCSALLRKFLSVHK